MASRAARDASWLSECYARNDKREEVAQQALMEADRGREEAAQRTEEYRRLCSEAAAERDAAQVELQRRELEEKRREQHHERMIAQREAERQQRLTKCWYCMCKEDRDLGVMCAKDHFLCNDCLSVVMPNAEAAASNGLKCMASSHCNCIIPTRLAAQHASERAFELFKGNLDSLKEQELQALYERRFRQREAELAAKSEIERRVQAARRGIEGMMEDRCPRCAEPFEGFDGCAALICGRAACKAGFCALCLQDCGADAHLHVRTCPLREDNFRDPYYLKEPAQETWRRVMNRQKREKLQQRWNTFDAHLQHGLSADRFVIGVFRELDLTHMLEQLPAVDVADAPAGDVMRRQELDYDAVAAELVHEGGDEFDRLLFNLRAIGMVEEEEIGRLMDY